MISRIYETIHSLFSVSVSVSDVSHIIFRFSSCLNVLTITGLTRLGSGSLSLSFFSLALFLASILCLLHDGEGGVHRVPLIGGAFEIYTRRVPAHIGRSIGGAKAIGPTDVIHTQACASYCFTHPSE